MTAREVLDSPLWGLLDGPVIQADCRDAVRFIPDCSIEAVVTDAPYEIGFMGGRWDRTGIAYDAGWWSEVLRVLKPGGHLLVFGSPRTYHRLGVAVEDAGFEIRDSLLWLHGEGFPKSKNVALAIDKSKGAPDRGRAIPMASTHFPNGEYAEGKKRLKANPVDPYEAVSAEAEAWKGWGTALKPAFEPILMARRPLAGTLVDTVLEHGTGALNIDATRIATDDAFGGGANGRGGFVAGYEAGDGWAQGSALGRWPPHVAMDELVAEELDEQSGERAAGVAGAASQGFAADGYVGGTASTKPGGFAPAGFGDYGGASRFMYVAKAKRDEREAGLAEHFRAQFSPTMQGSFGGVEQTEEEARPKYNTHTTVKPIELMRWLVRMVVPPGGVCWDPFAGSGTTGCGAAVEDIMFAGCELSAEYTEIANARIDFWGKHPPGKPVPKVLEVERQKRVLADMGQMEML